MTTATTDRIWIRYAEASQLYNLSIRTLERIVAENGVARSKPRGGGVLLRAADLEAAIESAVVAVPAEEMKA
jgi:excisionase family DNA binding protein